MDHIKQIAWNVADIYSQCSDFELSNNHEFHGTTFVDYNGWPTLHHEAYGIVDIMPTEQEGLLIQITDVNTGECVEREISPENVNNDAIGDILETIREMFESLD